MSPGVEDAWAAGPDLEIEMKYPLQSPLVLAVTVTVPTRLHRDPRARAKLLTLFVVV